MGIGLYNYQYDALKRMHNGCILCGGVGSGKSRTSLAYYYTQMGGHLGNLPWEKRIMRVKVAECKDIFETVETCEAV